MFCKFCGTKCEGNFCGNCGAPVTAPVTEPAEVEHAISSQTMPEPMSSGEAIVVLIAGIVCGLLPNIVSIALAIMALVKASNASIAFSKGDADGVARENAKGASYFKYSWICLTISLSLSVVAFAVGFFIGI